MICNQAALANALMFDHAYSILNERFQQGAKLLDQKELGLFVPVAVNCTFSCELFLKSMLPAGTGGHELYNKLFKKLDAQLADVIKQSVVQIMRDTKIDYTAADFERDLLTHELAFKEWQYFHEGKPLPTFDLQFMSTLQACLKGIAIAKNNGAI